MVGGLGLLVTNYQSGKAARIHAAIAAADPERMLCKCGHLETAHRDECIVDGCACPEFAG